MAATALQGVTSKLDAWAAKRRLMFSTSKIINLVFIKKTNKVITNKEITQFLEMTLDSRLNWEEHIERESIKNH